YLVESSRVIRAFGPIFINYLGISSLVLEAGGKNADIAILDTPATMAVTINAGAVGDNVQTGGVLVGNASRIQGPLTVNGGGNATFTVFDQSTTTPQTYTVTDTSLTRSGGFAVTYANLHSLT